MGLEIHDIVNLDCLKLSSSCTIIQVSTHQNNWSEGINLLSHTLYLGLLILFHCNFNNSIYNLQITK